jgi:hypothetical protein
MMMLRLPMAVLLMYAAGWLGAQVPLGQSDKGVVYNKELGVNIKMLTNRGFAPGISFGQLRSYYKTTFFDISVGELKHPKERRQSADPSVGRSFRPYVYGKQNNLVTLRTAWGVKRYFTEKAQTRGVAVGISYAAGPTLGLLKPYYLALRRPAPDNPGFSRVTSERYSEENSGIFLDNSRILGASPFTRGLGESSFIPGGHASLALHLDWGAYDEYIKALEIGVMLDVFARDTPLMVAERSSPLFLNFFVNLQLGRRK